MTKVVVAVVQLLGCIWLFVTSWTVAHQAPLSFTVSWSLLKLMSIDQWFHPAISSSVAPFSSCPESFPASRSFPMSWLFASGGQRIGASASASVLPKTIQSWFPLGLTGLISLQSRGSSRVFSNTTIWKHQFFGAQSSLWPSSHGLLGKPRSQSLFPEDTCCPSSPPHLDINNSSIATTVTSQNSTDHGCIINFDCITFKFVSHSKQETSWGENQLLFMFVPTVPPVPASPWGYTVTAEGLGGCTAELRRVGSMIWWINVPLTNSQQPFSYLNRTVSAAPRNCFQCSSRMTHFCTWNLPLGGKLLKALVQLWRGRRQG